MSADKYSSLFSNQVGAIVYYMVGPAYHSTSKDMSTTENISLRVQMSLITTSSQLTIFAPKGLSKIRPRGPKHFTLNIYRK